MSEADVFMWDVAEWLGRPDLTHTIAFQEFCLNTFDHLTVEQAGDFWRLRTVAEEIES